MQAFCHFMAFWHVCQKANCITKSAFSAFSRLFPPFRLFHRIRLFSSNQYHDWECRMGNMVVKQRIMLAHATSSSTTFKHSPQKYTTHILQFMFPMSDSVNRICLIIVSTFLRILRRKTITWQKQPEGNPELKLSL